MALGFVVPGLFVPNVNCNPTAATDAAITTTTAAAMNASDAAVAYAASEDPVAAIGAGLQTMFIVYAAVCAAIALAVVLGEDRRGSGVFLKENVF